MVTYRFIRRYARTGDIILVKGNRIGAWLIRVLTGESISHVAILVWIGQTLWIAEMKLYGGFRLRPASLWIEDGLKAGKTLLWGKAPLKVHDNGEQVKDAIFSYRRKPYGVLDLMRVWLSQVFRMGRGPTDVCSGLVQAAWEAAGLRFEKSLDPGDLLSLCREVTPIRRSSR